MDTAAVIFWLGLTVLLIGAILTNLAVKKMAKIVRLHWEVGYKNDSASRRNRETIRRYRETHENGQLYTDLKVAYWICGVGAAVIVVAAIIEHKL